MAHQNVSLDSRASRASPASHASHASHASRASRASRASIIGFISAYIYNINTIFQLSRNKLTNGNNHKYSNKTKHKQLTTHTQYLQWTGIGINYF